MRSREVVFRSHLSFRRAPFIVEEVIQNIEDILEKFHKSVLVDCFRL